MEKLEAYLILGCNGHCGKDGFINCTGISNVVIDLEELGDGTYARLLQFLEGPCELFEKAMYNRNKVANTLAMIHRDYGAIPQKMLFNIQGFMQMHRKCGHYMILIMKEDYTKHG